MALRLYNGAGFDSFLGTTAIGSGQTSLTTSFIAGPARTAPNTSNKITGCLFFLNSIPSSGNIEVEVRESGVSKVSGIAVQADLKLGFNYVRFGTPYQFTTTGSNAYVPYIRKVTTTSGAVAQDGASAIPFLALTTDQTPALGATDNIMIGGFHNTGLTPQTYTPTGTANSWGSGANKGVVTSNRLLNMATCVFNGGTLKWDTAADCKITQYGNCWASAGGLIDMRPGPSSVSTLEFTNDADGDFSLGSFTSSYGGQVLTTGKTVVVAATYNGGLGTAASPAVFTAAHGFSVGDELVIGWGSDYLKNEVRFVISIPSSTQVVWSSTKGGSETALAYTHAAGFPVCNMTRNSIIKNTDPTRGFVVLNNSTTAQSDFSYTRFEYANCSSGKGLQLSSSNYSTPCNGLVAYNNSANGRTSIQYSGSIEETLSDIILYNTRGSNFSAQSGLVFGGSRKTARRIYHFAEPGSTNNCAGLSIAAAAIGCAVDGFYSSGANAGNSSLGYALGIFGSGHTFNNIVIDGARLCGVRLGSVQEIEVTNSKFGTIATNVADVLLDTAAFTKARFLSSSFGSGTLLADYLTALAGTDVAFQDMDGNSSKHRWYTNNASFWSSGSGLPDTTVRTAGSLALAIKPEDAVDGTKSLILKVPANPTSQVVFYGYIFRNATFSSGDITVDLFLPGTLTTSTPDATYTLPTTTGAWLPFTISAYYPGSVARYAKVRITAKTATPGAYAFLDDIYDAATGNKVAGLDLWDDGHISPVIVASDYSSIPDQTRKAVWGDTDTYLVGSKGRIHTDTGDTVDITQAKVDVL